ncbi:MAG: glucosaminidase domain-containing protein [Alphaproteobacteria bacterium]|nr:glucosaminidase domain-containing protein [Alphaproteobacteria bacterium]
MDAAVAQSLASGIDPTAIGALKAHPDDPAVRRAVAGQFGAMLMEGLMRDADGSALPMVDGVGSDTVNTLYANVMSQVAASSNQLGFADMLLQSMPKAAPPPAATGATPASPTPTTPAHAAAGAGFLLQQYWQGRHVIVSPGAAYAIAPSSTGTRPVVPAGPAPVTLPSAVPPTSPSPYNAPVGPGAQLTPAGGSTAADRQQFAATLAPLLQGAAQSLGVSPNVLLAQAALESGWGRSIPGNNLFGVKAGAGWNGGTVQAYTHEASATGEVGETTQFRAYPSLAAAVADYVQLIAHNARYRAALGAGADPMAYGQALVAGGYATDPDYASKLAAVAGSPTITAALDTPAGTTVAQVATTGGAA